jgi:hypothetical protein
MVGSWCIAALKSQFSPPNRRWKKHRYLTDVFSGIERSDIYLAMRLGDQMIDNPTALWKVSRSLRRSCLSLRYYTVCQERLDVHNGDLLA